MAGNNLLTNLLLNSTQFDTNIRKSSQQVQDFQKKTQGISNAVSSSFSAMSGAVKKLAPALGLAMGAYEAFNKTVNSSETMIDAWGRTVRETNTVVDSFFTSITAGNFSNFISGLESIAKSARDAYNEIDNLGTMIAFQDVELAKIESRRVDIEYKIKVGKSRGEDVSALQDQLLGTNEEIASLMKERAEQATKAWRASVKEAVQKQTGGWYDESIADKYSNWADFKTLSKASLDAEGRDIEKRKEALGHTYDYALVNLKAYQKLQAEGRLSEKGQLALQLINEERIYETKRAILEQESKITEANKYQVTAANAMAKAAQARLQAVKYTESVESKNSGNTKASFDKKKSLAEDGSLSDLQRQLKYWQTEFANAGTIAGQNFANNMIKAIEKQIKSLESPFKAMDSLRLKAESNMSKLPKSFEQVTKKSEDYNKSLVAISAATSTLGSIMTVSGDQGVMAFSNLLQSIVPLIGAVMALTVAEGEEKAAHSAKNWIELVAAVGAVTAAIVSTFAANKNAGKFANGGIVGGNSYSGDNLIAHVNSGEMILNAGQQRNLFNLLNTGAVSKNSGQVEFKIKGQELYGVLRNFNNKNNKLM